MRYFKYPYLIIIISILNYSCNNVSEENSDGQILKPKVFNCLLDKIGKKDTLYINYSTQGCFHYLTEELKIYRKLDSLFAELNVSIPRREKYPSLMQYLKDSSIIAYSEFEKSGRTLKTSDGCTTSEKFIVSIMTYTIKFEDNGCEYEGYSILKNKIFGQAKIDSFYEKIYH